MGPNALLTFLTDGVVEGPLLFDNAEVSRASAMVKDFSDAEALAACMIAVLFCWHC